MGLIQYYSEPIDVLERHLRFERIGSDHMIRGNNKVIGCELVHLIFFSVRSMVEAPFESYGNMLLNLLLPVHHCTERTEEECPSAIDQFFLVLDVRYGGS